MKPPFRRAYHHIHRTPRLHDRPDWRRRRGRLFFRFAGLFGLLMMLILCAAFALLAPLTRHTDGQGRLPIIFLASGVALLITLPGLIVAIAVRAFRNVATPLAQVMDAADRVAEGDLSARVPDDNPSDLGRGESRYSEFRRLAHSFNHMVQELQLADQRRRNLTADVAHELRTPLHIIQGNLEGVLDGVYACDAEHIEATLDETRLLARLIDDLRTLSLAEAGQLPLHLEQVDLVELIADVATSFSGQAESTGVELRTDIPASPLVITADADRIDQVLGNLIANALHYTPAGGRIAISAQPIDGGARIRVTDTGAGIPADDLPYIFDRFWRGDRARTRVDGSGSGLGLAIARQLVQAHGGRIYVESQVGQGSIFTIELPSWLPAA